MNLDKIIYQLESKETLLIFLRDNFPDVLDAWKNRMSSGTRPDNHNCFADTTNEDFRKSNGGDDEYTSFRQQ